MAEVVHRIVVKIYLGNVTRQVSVNVGALEEFTFEMLCQRTSAVAPDVDLSQLRWKEPIEGDFIHLATTAGLYEALLNLVPVLCGKEILRIYGTTVSVPNVCNVVESRSVSQQHNSSDDSYQVGNGAASTKADFVLVKIEEMQEEAEATKETLGGSGARSGPIGVTEEATATPAVGDVTSEMVGAGIRNVLSNNTSTPIFPVISNVCSESTFSQAITAPVDFLLNDTESGSFSFSSRQMSNDESFQVSNVSPRSDELLHVKVEPDDEALANESRRDAAMIAEGAVSPLKLGSDESSVAEGTFDHRDDDGSEMEMECLAAGPDKSMLKNRRGRPRVYASGAAKQKAYRERHRPDVLSRDRLRKIRVRSERKRIRKQTA